MPALPPLDAPETEILKLYDNNPASRTARALSAALKISVTDIDSSNPDDSRGPDYLANRFREKVDLNTLNRFKVILSKREGCEILRQLGVFNLSDKYLNRYIDDAAYHDEFRRSVSRCRGRGNGKLVFTYSEIIYFYSKVLNQNIPNQMPPFPETLAALAEEGEALFPG